MPRALYELSLEGQALLQLTLSGNRAHAEKVTGAGEELSLVKSTWNDEWFFDGAEKRLFGRVNFGWKFHNSFRFASGEEIWMSCKNRNPFRKRRPGEADFTATFSRQEMPVMVLRRFYSGTILLTSQSAFLGALSTDNLDIHFLTATLLVFHTYQKTRYESA